MSIREVTMYQIVCDWPSCGKDAHLDEGGDYAGWAEVETARDEAGNAGWHRGKDGNDYCHRHPTTWASDHEDGDPLPEPPYLLIHDGDTGDNRDDGLVSYIGVTS